MRTRVRVACVAALLCLTSGLAACSFSWDDSDSLVVETEHGKVRGITTEGIHAWRGIPFAAPPVDDLRWEPPEPPDDWTGTRSAGAYSAKCIQGGPTPGQTGVLVAPGSSEDCLYLNVNAPEDADDLPVIVVIHGGGFVVGSGVYPIANSPAMVQRGVVLVSINYRLGRFGFFAHPALGGDIANFGLLDQVAALEWVRDNIAGFGGDRHNVTILGQSAGGMSVNALMTSPAADGLFDQAVVQSGLGREESISMAEARDQGADFLPGMDADELRDLDAEKILGPPQDVLAGELPILDEVLPQRVADAFAAGDEAAVPYLIGTNSAEFPDPVLTSLGRSPVAARNVIMGNKRAEFLALYGGEVGVAFHLISDAIFTEPARYLARLHSARAPTYRYRFSIASPDEIAGQGGAIHSAEATFVFDFVGADADLADEISDYWASFATTGDPNHGGAPAWPTAAGDALMDFTNDGPVAEKPDPWDPRLDEVEAAAERLS